MSFESALEPLLDCLCSSLGAAGWEGECCLNPGNPSLEMCCENGGMAWGRLIKAYPSANFPQEDVGKLTECTATMSWALIVELGASVCVCDDLCDCAVKGANASKVLGIAEAGLRGLLCCFSSGACQDTEYQLNSLEIGGPLGNCGGFTVELIRQYTMSCCPPEESP